LVVLVMMVLRPLWYYSCMLEICLVVFVEGGVLVVCMSSWCWQLSVEMLRILGKLRMGICWKVV